MNTLRRVALSSAILCSLLAGGVSLFASDLTNPDFETGDLTGWTFTNSSQVTVTGATSVNTYNGNTWNITPNGSWMAQVVGYSTSADDLDGFFGLPTGTIGAQIPNASYGDGMEQTFTGSQGDQISMDWSLVEADYPPFNDTVFVVVNQGNTNVLYQNLGCLTGGCPNVVGNGGTQPWTAFTYTLPADGTYTIGFGAVNTYDNEYDPVLFLDDQAGSFTSPSDTPEPVTCGLSGAGLLALWAIRRKKQAI
jgi:hypothetical protein